MVNDNGARIIQEATCGKEVSESSATIYVFVFRILISAAYASIDVCARVFAEKLEIYEELYDGELEA